MSTGEEFVQEFHAARAGATSRQMSSARLAGGGSSYQWLADALQPVVAGQLLDVGCGDGPLLEELIRRGASPAHLTGVDVSPAELALAAGRPTLRGVSLRHARAQALPLESGSVDGIGCHMALMVMDDVEAVIAELARVLRPGGTLAVVVGGGVPPEGAFAIFAELFGRRWRDRHVARPVEIGDHRTFTEEGLRSLFEGPFAALELVSDRLELGGSAEQVWRNLADTYDVAMLDGSQRAALRSELLAAIEAAGHPRDAVPMSIGVLRLVATRVA